METRVLTRRNDLDWLRVLATVAVFLFHSFRFFDLDNPWSVRNAVTYKSLEICVTFMVQWMMPFLFVISAAGIVYSLRSRGAGAFAKERSLRLLVPLVVGIFTHSILQVYLERVFHGEFHGTFWQFLPHYFDGLYAFGGNFAWMGVHLWYLEILFVLSMVLLPLFVLASRGRNLAARVGDFLSRSGLVYLLCIPTILILALVDRHSILGRPDLGGWSLMAHAWFLAGGFILFSSERLQASVRRLRWVSLAVAVLSGVVPLLLHEMLFPSGLPGTILPVIASRRWDVSSWAFILTFLGFGMKHLDRRTALLDYANEAVLPFYILHHPVLLTIGFFVVLWPIPDLLKWCIIVLSSLAGIIGLYELAVRRIGLLRFLFGMKARPRLAQVREVEA